MASRPGNVSIKHKNGSGDVLVSYTAMARKPYWWNVNAMGRAPDILRQTYDEFRQPETHYDDNPCQAQMFHSRKQAHT